MDININGAQYGLLLKQKDILIQRKYFEEMCSTLLDLGLVEKNEYFVKYCDLVLSNRATMRQPHCTQRHHIVPCSVYRYFDTDINNDNSNIVNLYYKDHLLAHYYLVNCAKVSWFKFSNMNVLTFVYNGVIPETDQGFLLSLPHYQELYEEYHKQLGSNPNRITIVKQKLTGTSRPQHVRDKIRHKLKGRRTHVLTIEERQTLSNSLRGHTVSEATRNAIGKSKLNKTYVYKVDDGTKMMVTHDDAERLVSNGEYQKENPNPKISITNSVKTIYIYPSELDAYEKLGYRLGHCHKTSQKLSNYVWINDGAQNKRVSKEDVSTFLEQGFNLGRTSFKNGKQQ